MKSIVLVLLVAGSASAITKEQVEAIARPAAKATYLDSVAVGVIDAHGRAVYGFGKNVPDGKTVFELGSISKVFTATILADMVQRGEVRLDQPVRGLLPADVKMPSKDGVEITLLHLTTHHSGIPRMPENFDPADAGNPYADYTPALLYEELGKMKLLRLPGTVYEYSNLGVGLLGHALSLKAGKGYERLLVERICTPLQMNDTRITLDERLCAHLAPGHDLGGVPQSNWDLNCLAGAGGIRSTADDMLKFLAANLALVDTPLAKAMKMTHERRADVDQSEDIGMGWIIAKRTGTRWHNGQTGGYHTYAAFLPEKKIGVVVLCNTASGMVDTIGVQLVKTMLGEPVEPIHADK